MNYKVGDKVRIRSEKSLCREFNIEAGAYLKKGSNWVTVMWQFCGKEFIVQNIEYNSNSGENAYILNINQNFNIWWDDWMLEDKREVRYQKLRNLYD